MSAFIVSDGTMQRAVAALDVNNSSCDQLDDLGRRLYALNAQAVGVRYRKEVEAPDFSYRPNFPSKIIALKALECLVYQCSEGKPMEDTALYQQMKSRIHQLRDEIVSSLPEYEAAPWDGHCITPEVAV